MYVQAGAPLARLLLLPLRCTDLPGFEAEVPAPTFTELPPSDAELEFVSAHAMRAPCVPTRAKTATATQIFIEGESRRLGRSELRSGIGLPGVWAKGGSVTRSPGLRRNVQVPERV